MGINKRGIFFTFAAVALSFVIILSYSSSQSYNSKNGMESLETRIDTTNSLIKNVESDMDNMIFTVGFRSLLSLEDYMMSSNPPKFLNQLGTNLNDAFEEVFKQGTINSQKMSLMENNSFSNWTNKMKLAANKTDIALDFTVNEVTITQSEPWMVDVSVDLEINIKDNKNTASWVIDKAFTRKINITGFVDPLYLVNNQGKVNNSIRKTIVPDFSSSGNLNTHLINSYYIEHSDAPNYLMRFDNGSGSSSNGIESLVNSQEIIDAGLPARSRSAVDYIYFGTQSTQDCIVKEPNYNWFYLDSNHLNFYEAECEH